MKRKVVFLENFLKGKMNAKNVRPDLIRDYLRDREVVHNRRVKTAKEINMHIEQLIENGTPFFVGRFGATELNATSTFDFEVKTKYCKALSQMQNWSGFFPSTVESGKKFKNLMLELIPEADVMGIWMLPFEDYYLNRYGKDNMQTTYLLDLEPWSSPGKPWSAALKGKRVLVIHPFADTIVKQYARRELIFPGTDILPEFELKTLKAVQTIAGEKDGRFETWFDALEWMYEEALKIDFDVAIIGCGAYGFPLAAKLRRAGKQAIHLAGATQLLFGIKGKRWEEGSAFTYVQKFFNDAWVHPGEEEKPKNAVSVENGCYW